MGILLGGHDKPQREEGFNTRRGKFLGLLNCLPKVGGNISRGSIGGAHERARRTTCWREVMPGRGVEGPLRKIVPYLGPSRSDSSSFDQVLLS